MPGIGSISPFYPFNHKTEFPGALWDGNTVAWYDYNDTKAGVYKDGANRVSAWFDKFNYAVGAEMVDQNNWYKAAWWNTFPAGFSTVGNTLVYNNVVTGHALKNNFWTPGKYYKIETTYQLNNGTGYFWYSSGGGDWGPISAPSGLVTRTVYFIATQPTLGFSVYQVGGLANCVCSSISIKEITGKGLLQNTAAAQPLYTVNGVSFDGTSDFLKTYTFPLIQPVFIYMVVKQDLWVIGDTFFDGNAVNSGRLEKHAVTPEIKLYNTIANGNMSLGQFHILRSLILGGVNACSIQVDQTPAVLGSLFAGGNMDGFTLGASGDSTNWCQMVVKEIIIRKIFDSPGTQTDIYNYLKSSNGL